MKRERGQTTVEYAMVIVLVCLVAFLSLKGVGAVVKLDFHATSYHMCDPEVWDCATGILAHPCPPGAVGSACDAYDKAHGG